MVFVFYGVLFLRTEAGSRPGGRGTCSLLRQRKVPKRKATHSLRPLRVATGQTCVGAVAGCAVELALRCARRSDNHGESVDEACARKRPCHPANAPPQAQPDGGGQPKSQTATRAIAALGPVCASRGACARAVWAERSDGLYGCPLAGSLQDAPRSAGFGGSGLASV